MSLLSVDPKEPDPAVLDRAAAVLRAGGLVAFPTETVYGLGAHALDPSAVGRIFQAKGRPGYNPLIVHTADPAGARRLAADWPETARRLAAAFWPGPLTLVVRKAPVIPDAVSAGLDTVALRVPAHPVALALLEAAGIPVAAPSANRSTQLSPTSAEHVARSLGDRVDLILDAGACPVGIESTVISLTAPRPTLLRPGSLSVDDLRAVVGQVTLPDAGIGRGDAARPSPGMLDRHYAPRAELVLFDGAEPAEAEALIRRTAEGGGRTGALTLTAELPEASERVRMPAAPREYAARLYSVLHDLDARGHDRILVERVPDTAPWAGVRDRLQRAAHPRA